MYIFNINTTQVPNFIFIAKYLSIIFYLLCKDVFFEYVFQQLNVISSNKLLNLQQFRSVLGQVVVYFLLFQLFVTIVLAKRFQLERCKTSVLILNYKNLTIGRMFYYVYTIKYFSVSPGVTQSYSSAFKSYLQAYN